MAVSPGPFGSQPCSLHGHPDCPHCLITSVAGRLIAGEQLVRSRWSVKSTARARKICAFCGGASLNLDFTGNAFNIVPAGCAVRLSGLLPAPSAARRNYPFTQKQGFVHASRSSWLAETLNNPENNFPIWTISPPPNSRSLLGTSA